jgi:hypothetical protein
VHLEEAIVVCNDVIGTAGGRFAEHEGLREGPAMPGARLDTAVGYKCWGRPRWYTPVFLGLAGFGSTKLNASSNRNQYHRVTGFLSW